MQRNKIQLYCNQVFVTDQVEGIVPEFLTLLHGVIDSPDIPLNVSRSYLQSDSNVKKISTYITKKVADRLSSIFKENRKEFEEKWGKPYPAISRLWRNAWSEFVPFLDYDVEIRKVICSTNAIEILNARYRRAVRARGHFPNEQAALKCVYLAVMALDPTGKGPLDPTMEGSPQRLRHPIRRPPQQPESSMTPQPSYTVNLTDPKPARPTRRSQRSQ